MQSELHRNNMYQSVELLLLVPMLFLLVILKCLLVFKESFYYAIILRYTVLLGHYNTTLYSTTGTLYTLQYRLL